MRLKSQRIGGSPGPGCHAFRAKRYEWPGGRTKRDKASVQRHAIDWRALELANMEAFATAASVGVSVLLSQQAMGIMAEKCKRVQVRCDGSVKHLMTGPK